MHVPNVHCPHVSRSLGDIGRLGSSTTKQLDAETSSINSAAIKEHGFGGSVLSAPNLFGSKMSSHRGSIANHSIGNGIESRLEEESNGSSDPDLSLTNKVDIQMRYRRSTDR